MYMSKTKHRSVAEKGGGGAEGASAPLPNYEKRGAEPLQISYYIIQVRLMSRSWDNVDSMHDQLLTVQP